MPRSGIHPALLVVCSLILLLFPECDQGLAPESSGSPEVIYGISGTIYFKNWPPQDSVVDLRVVSFKHHPSQDILTEVMQGKAGFTGTLLPYGADSIRYSLGLTPIPPGPFAYTVVAQRFGQNINTDWRAVGVYYASGDTLQPGSIDVPGNGLLSGINISVDFHHLPPPP